MQNGYDQITVGTNTDRAVAYIEMIASDKKRLRFEYGPKSSLKLSMWLLKATIECAFRRAFLKRRT